MARTQQRLTDDTVIEETRQAGVFRRRRIGLLKRWADEEVTLSLARKRPGNPEPDDVVPFRGIVPAADGGTEAVRWDVIGTAPEDAPLTITRTQPCTPINWGVFIVLMFDRAKGSWRAVFYPLLDIACRVMHTKRICAV